MRRNLRCTPSLFLALRDKIHGVDHNIPQYIQHPLRYLSRHLSATTNLSFSKPAIDNPIAGPAIHASFSSSADGQEEESHSDAEHEFDSGGDEATTGDENADDQCCSRDLEAIADILRTPGVQEKSRKLEQCGVNASPGLVANVLSGTRNDWEAAFTFFLWAGKQPGYTHSLREYHSMIAILGKFRKFDTAWALIDEMRALSLVTTHTLLIMIRRYAAVHDVGKAIGAFYALRRFKFDIGLEEFQRMLAALCRYKNVKDAEHMLFCNKDVFPLNTKSFNIILNGWCNVIGSLREGQRIWNEMETRGVKPDVYSYSSIMSCYSKANHLNKVVRFYEKMKSLGVKPDKKVYNAVIHALAKGKLLKEAHNVMKTMEDEGFKPDAITYNSLIMPLCKSRLLDEAQHAFDEMTERGLQPSIRTYHGFFRALRTGEQVFELLRKMSTSGCNPSHETYIMLIRKFCRWRQLDDVYKVWGEMSKNGLDPDRSSYIVLIHGLFLNGRLDEAHKYYLEMKEKQFLPEPKIDEVLRAWVAGKGDGDLNVVVSKENQTVCSEVGERVRGKSGKSGKSQRENDFLRQPESRSVTRERGFSFWD
ncbi:hypothetical protein ACP275_08G076000 [Erythranthe tilingii]